MGTRNLTFVQLGGKLKVAQYCQWDGYPDGQGKTVLEFLKARIANNFELEAFKDLVGQCSFLSRTKIRILWENATDKEREGKYLHLSRDPGAEVLEMIFKSKHGLKLLDETAFAADSLFCEYAYLINLDNNVLEAYKGFQKEPLAASERFANLPREKEDSEYYQIKLVASWPFNALPDFEEFKNQIDPPEEDE